MQKQTILSIPVKSYQREWIRRMAYDKDISIAQMIRVLLEKSGMPNEGMPNEGKNKNAKR